MVVNHRALLPANKGATGVTSKPKSVPAMGKQKSKHPKRGVVGPAKAQQGVPAAVSRLDDAIIDYDSGIVTPMNRETRRAISAGVYRLPLYPPLPIREGHMHRIAAPVFVDGSWQLKLMPQPFNVPVRSQYSYRVRPRKPKSSTTESFEADAKEDRHLDVAFYKQRDRAKKRTAQWHMTRGAMAKRSVGEEEEKGEGGWMRQKKRKDKDQGPTDPISFMKWWTTSSGRLTAPKALLKRVLKFPYRGDDWVNAAIHLPLFMRDEKYIYQVGDRWFWLGTDKRVETRLFAEPMPNGQRQSVVRPLWTKDVLHAHLRKNDADWQRLLKLSGDVEENPGPHDFPPSDGVFYFKEGCAFMDGNWRQRKDLGKFCLFCGASVHVHKKMTRKGGSDSYFHFVAHDDATDTSKNYYGDIDRFCETYDDAVKFYKDKRFRRKEESASEAETQPERTVGVPYPERAEKIAQLTKVEPIGEHCDPPALELEVALPDWHVPSFVVDLMPQPPPLNNGNVIAGDDVPVLRGCVLNKTQLKLFIDAVRTGYVISSNCVTYVAGRWRHDQRAIMDRYGVLCNSRMEIREVNTIEVELDWDAIRSLLSSAVCAVGLGLSYVTWMSTVLMMRVPIVPRYAGSKISGARSSAMRVMRFFDQHIAIKSPLHFVSHTYAYSPHALACMKRELSGRSSEEAKKAKYANALRLGNLPVADRRGDIWEGTHEAMDVVIDTNPRLFGLRPLP